MSIHVPYTIIRNRTYFYNRRIGSELIRISLRTKEDNKALQLVPSVDKVVMNMVRQDVRIELIRQAARTWLKRKLDQADIDLALAEPLNDNQIKAELQPYSEKKLHSDLQVAKLDLKEREYSARQTDAEALNAEFSLRLSSDEQQVLMRSLTQANIQFLERLQSGQTWDDKLSSNSKELHTTEPKVSPRISELLEEFTEERRRENPTMPEKTHEAYKQDVGIFIEIMGDIEIEQLDKAAVRKFKESLGKYPKNRNKGAKANKTLEELEAEEVETISATTITNKYQKTSTFINWAVRNDYLDKNPMSDLSPPKQKSDRLPYTPELLHRIFNDDIFTKHAFKEEYTTDFWCPLIALFTGMRVNEICQLKVHHIKKEDGVDFISLKDPELKIKTDSSKRDIPIHHKLIELGFLNFIRSIDEGYLFPKLAESKQAKEEKDFGDVYSKRFTRFRRKLEITDEYKFHCFRNTMTDALRDADVPREYREAILGHAPESITDRVYSSGLKVQKLAPWIQKVSYPEVLDNVKPWI